MQNMNTNDDLRGFVSIELDKKGDVLPPKNGLIALVDADTLAFSACSVTEESMSALPRECYIDEEWEEMVQDPNFDTENMIIYHPNPEQALIHAQNKIQDILDATGCISAELHFTGGRENFRYSVMSTYKSNRKDSHIPAGLRELKDKLLTLYEGTMCTEWEADDIVVCKYYEEPEKYLVVAVDKDVLGSVPKAFNYYYKKADYGAKHYAEIPMKFIENSEESIVRHPFLQTLMGDSSDGIQGIKGIGKVRANKILAQAVDNTPKELWAVVVEAFELACMSEFDAIQFMQLVAMRQLKLVDGEWTVVRWLPKFD